MTKILRLEDGVASSRLRFDQKTVKGEAPFACSTADKVEVIRRTHVAFCLLRPWGVIRSSIPTAELPERRKNVTSYFSYFPTVNKRV